MSAGNGHAGDPLLLRIRSLGEQLREALGPLVAAAIAGPLKAVVLSRKIGLDTTLAGRLVRALRSNDPLATVREIPAPHGLRIFLRSIEGDADPEDLRRAQAAIDEFEALIAEFPGGRGALDTAIAGWLPDVRERTEHAAKQTMFRAAAQVFGNVCDTIVAANILHPGQDVRMLDHVFVSMKTGMRRLRVGAPLSVSGFITKQPESPQPALPRLETLDGTAWPRDPREYLVPELCDPAGVPLRPVHRGITTELVLDRDQPPVNRPVNLGWVVVVRNAAQRAEPQTRILGTSSRVPAQLLCFDLVLHEALCAAAKPEVIARMPPAAGAASGVEPGEIDHLELATPMNELGGIDQIGLSEAPVYSRSLPQFLTRLQYDPRAFRVFRCRVAYPVPFVELVCRFETTAAT